MRDRAATRALVLGLLALPFGVFAPFAIFSGLRSLRRIRASGGELRGATRAMAGLTAGVIALATLVVGIAYWWLAS
ncbi:MAG: DUF4190 domain-containing protein [Chloroflexi bacterium]|nr:MAG: DUF4190 domain-containing protein [Chloroflexota bacterium]TMF36324.1 MAG: DUF4190 domain-containing protein [Chloroflexota bacterium]